MNTNYKLIEGEIQYTLLLENNPKKNKLKIYHLGIKRICN